MGSFSTSNGLISMVYASAQQSTIFVLETTSDTFATVGKALYGTSGGYTPKAWLPSVNSLGAFPTIWQGDIAAVSGAPGGIQTTLGVNVVSVTPFVTPVMSLEAGPDALLAAGQLWDYNGVTVAEHSFHLYPDQLGVSSPGFLCTVSNVGGVQVRTIACPPASQISPGQWLSFVDVGGVQWEWYFPVGGATGKVDTDPTYANRTVVGGYSVSSSAYDVAVCLLNAILSSGVGFVGGSTSVSNDGVISITQGGFLPYVNGQTFYIETTQLGVPGTKELTTIICPSGAHILSGQWFSLADNTVGDFHALIWFNRTDVTDPGGPFNGPQQIVGGYGVTTANNNVDILSTDTAAQVAAKVVARIGVITGGANAGVATQNVIKCTPTAAVATNQSHSSNPGHVGGRVGESVFPGGTYGVTATYRWLDNGQQQESAPTPQIFVQAGNSGTFVTGIAATSPGSEGSGILVTVPTLQFTNKPNVEIVLWATLLNGSDFFRVTLPGQVLNDQTKASVDIQFALGDAVLAAADQLYTNGSPGQLENIGPPAAKIIISHRGRVVLGGLEGDPTGIWYSQVLGPNTPAQFSDLLTIHFPQPVTAMGSMDDTLVVWTKSGIFFVGGEGPAPNGLGSSFTTPSYMPGGIGCTTPNSIVQTPTGLMFYSTTGTGIFSETQSPVYTLTRNFQLAPTGDDATGLFASLGYPVAAFTVPSTSQVRFIFSLTSPSVVMYDYAEDQWGTFTYPVAPVDAVIWNNHFVWGTLNSGVFQEATAATTDGGSAYTMDLTTGWIAIQGTAQGPMVVPGAQEYDRVRTAFLLATIAVGQQVTMGASYDDDPTFVDTDVWTAAAGVTYPSGQAGSPPNQARFDLHRQRLRSLQLRFSGIPPGVVLESLLLDVGVEDGPYKVGAPMGNYL